MDPEVQIMAALVIREQAESPEHAQVAFDLFAEEAEGGEEETVESVTATDTSTLTDTRGQQTLNERELTESRQEGEVWQGPSGHWFTKKNGRTVHTTNPNASAEPEKPSGLLAAAQARLSQAGQKVYNSLPAPAKKLVDIGQAVEHRLEGFYRSGQELAQSVAEEQGLGQEHVQRVARVLAVADAAARWTTNVPVAHHALHVLAHIGGPVAMLGSKLAYYAPVASLAYIGYHMTKETLSGGNPVELIRAARERVKARKEWLGSYSGGSSGH